MSDHLYERQKRALVEHLRDYQSASRLSKKGQTMIFDKHRLPDGGYAPQLKEELKEARIAFAKEWGMNGWRNEHFIKNMIEEAQRPDEAAIKEMHRQYKDTVKDIEQQEQRPSSSERFRNHLNEQSLKQKDGHKPKMG